MTQIRLAFFSKYFAVRTVKLGLAACAMLLASFAISPAQAHAPRHIVEAPCGPSYVALVYYHGSYYHRDAWVEWAHYTHLDFSQASVHLFPAKHFRHGHYVGPGAIPFSKEFFFHHAPMAPMHAKYGKQHGMKHGMKHNMKHGLRAGNNRRVWQ